MTHSTQSSSARLPIEPSPLAKELQQMIAELNAQRAARKPLPVPDEPPARPYILATPVDINRSAAELSAEIVQLANANRLERTGMGITAPVQGVMERMLVKGAEQPPTPQQLQGITDHSRALGLTETPQMSTLLQASFWRAHNAPDRAELLEQAAQLAETTFARQQALAQKVEPAFDTEPSLDYDDGPSMDID